MVRLSYSKKLGIGATHQNPKDNAHRKGYPPFQVRSLVFEMEGDEYRDGDYGHVRCESKPT